MQPSAFGGFGTHAPGTTIQSVVFRLHLRRETCTNGQGKSTSMIPLIVFVFGEFSSPVRDEASVLLLNCARRCFFGEGGCLLFAPRKSLVATRHLKSIKFKKNIMGNIVTSSLICYLIFCSGDVFKKSYDLCRKCSIPKMQSFFEKTFEVKPTIPTSPIVVESCGGFYLGDGRTSEPARLTSFFSIHPSSQTPMCISPSTSSFTRSGT